MTEPLRPTLNLGYGSGDPVGIPNYRPMNPWGRGMPKPVRQPRPALWQIMAMVDGKRTPLGPMMQKEFAESLLTELNKASIATGGKVWWAEPELVCVSTGGEKPSRGLRVAL